MEFIDIAAEQTTAATDLVNFFLGFVLAFVIAGNGHPGDRGRSRYWALIFLLIGFAAGAGALAHGVVMSEKINRIVWMPLNLSLGLVISILLTMVVREMRGAGKAKRSMPFFIGMGIGFFILTLLVPGIFLLFILFEGIAVFISFFAFIRLARTREDPYYKQITGVMIAVILFSVLFALVNAFGGLSVTVVWEFDQNGIFHLIQSVLMALLALVLVKS